MADNDTPWELEEDDDLDTLENEKDFNFLALGMLALIVIFILAIVLS